MIGSRPKLTRVSWIVCAWLLLLPCLAAAEPSLAVDLDGDGRRDRVVLDHRQPSSLRIWLSASGTTEVIHSGVPLFRVVASDLDGDHRPELIAGDTALRIHVWGRAHERFQSFRPRSPHPVTASQQSRRRVNDDDGEPADTIAGTTLPPYALILCASPRAPALAISARSAPETPRASRSFAAIAAFAPRPPPSARLR